MSICEDCFQNEVTCQCQECGAEICERCFNENHSYGKCRFDD